MAGLQARTRSITGVIRRGRELRERPERVQDADGRWPTLPVVRPSGLGRSVTQAEGAGRSCHASSAPANTETAGLESPMADRRRRGRRRSAKALPPLPAIQVTFQLLTLPSTESRHSGKTRDGGSGRHSLPVPPAPRTAKRRVAQAPVALYRVFPTDALA